MTFLWICWSIDGLALLAAVYFFLRALPAARSLDTTFFMGWLVLITVPYASISISYWLQVYGHFLLAGLTAAVPALPAVFFVGLMLLLTYSETDRSHLRAV